MNNDLQLYNVNTLHELYAVAFWKVYGHFPKNESGQTKVDLIHSINVLSYKLQSKGE
jgi:hypothetical protein